jgi:hypothetical protein
MTFQTEATAFRGASVFNSTTTAPKLIEAAGSAAYPDTLANINTSASYCTLRHVADVLLANHDPIAI